MQKIKMKICSDSIQRAVGELSLRNINEKYPIETKDHKGITLIALIITIITMLILVAVTITIVLNGGLFSTAKQAKNDTQGVINAEQTLPNGRVKIDSIWYDSIENYIAGIESEDQNDEQGKWVENKDEDGNITITDGTVTLKVGDYVNYEEIVKANPLTITSDSQLIKDLQEYSGSKSYNTESTITQETSLKWRVLDVKNGNLRLISEYPTVFTVYLNSYNGYNNAVYLIDEVCDTLYSVDGKGKARNLKIEDIEDKIDINQFDYTEGENETGEKYGETKELKNESFRLKIGYPEIFLKEKKEWVYDEQGKVEGEELYDISEQNKLINQTDRKTAGSKIKMTVTAWRRVMQENDWKDKTYQNIFIIDNQAYNQYWLSSRCVKGDDKKVYYCVSAVDSEVKCFDLYSFDNSGYIHSNGRCHVRPVVTLISNTQIEKKNDTWQIKQ